ncbi:S1C family serine protease [Halobaculum rarum]|uniref:S1C family serine protease n=1 Tax=Halobaculum rarum TaxID=3075122 RepID=UPI0032B023D5
MSTRYWVLGAIVLIMVVAPATGGVLASTADGTGIAQSQQTDGAAACNYSSLYDQTIDSVVAIRTDTGQGSGFVYQTGETNSASYIVTNAHVVGSAESVIVGFARDESKLGTVIGRDRSTDLAVVRVNETPGYVEALSVADTPPEQGSKVAAIGNPFGLEETITHGIVSGLNRSMPTKNGFSIPNVVQTDAPINPGNSGGPLVGCDGTVVGVNSAGIAAERADNIGFAISPNLVNRVVPELIDSGEYNHSFLGVSSAPLTPGLIAANDLTVTSGLYVHKAVEGGPASDVLQGTTDTVARNGSRIPVGGDVIVSIDGRSVSSGEDLSSYLLTETRPGDEVTLTIIRDGERQQVTVTLGERPESPV